MSDTHFTLDEVFSAYKKLKHYVYYDNTSLFIKKMISDFEDARDVAINDELYIHKKLEKLVVDINEKSEDAWLEYFQENISYRITPKEFAKKQKTILTNKVDKGSNELKRINIFIDTTVEVHIIAVLWLMCVGRFYSHKLDGHNYAYKLELSGDEEERSVVRGLRLFKPYFIQYQDWRDKALGKAEQLLDEKKNVTILSLDIKEYFNCVRLNLRKKEQELYSENKKLSDNYKVKILFTLLNNINSTYTDKIKDVINLKTIATNESILPIGLLSSGLLGNLYLLDFDNDIKDKLNPAYYGRYVDDILFVFSDAEVIQNAISPINFFLSKYFVSRDILKFENPDSITPSLYDVKRLEYIEPNIDKLSDDDYFKLNRQCEAIKFIIGKLPNLSIQSNKVILQSFDYKGSRAIINNFKKRLEEKRSEFRFLPDEDEIDKQFEEEAFSLQYSDSINKLRSIKDFSEDKYGASKYLASKIFASNYSDDKIDKETVHQILSFFNGVTGLAFHSLWEKVVTYFLINEQSDVLMKFYRQMIKSIHKIDINKLDSFYINPGQIKDKLLRDLNEYFTIAFAIPLALTPEFPFQRVTREEKDTFTLIRELAIKIRKANMFRHSLISLPAINFSKFLYTTSSLIKIDEDNLNDEILQLDSRLTLLSPRYVHFHEMNILEIYKVIGSVKISNSDAMSRFDKLLDNAFENYWIVNYKWRHLNDGNTSERINSLKKQYFNIGLGDKDGSNFNSITIPSREKAKIDKKIAIANIKVNKTDIKGSILKSPNIDRNRRQTLFKLINLVEQESCNLFVLPEVSIPYQWIKLLAYQSQRRNIGIIAGLEHWINSHGFAFNFMATVLPVHIGSYSTCIIKIRLKNHYSHEEKEQLSGYRLFVPGEALGKQYKNYDLFHWEKTYFSVYNCFELADIRDRSLFKSKVDFIVASEYNSDTEYFSEIAGSWVRDLHCYFIQVNSSDYGDSRLLKPAKSFAKNIIQIKGGDNSAILVGKIQIEELRNFQLMEYNLQKEEISRNPTTFKPTPPDYDRTFVQRRLKNMEIK